MRADITGFRLKLDSMTLAQFMPMHLLLDAEGCALSFGPTLAQILQGDARLGAQFEDMFDVRSPGGAVTIHEVLARARNRFRIFTRNEMRVGLRGHGQRLPGDGRILLNLTFIDLITAVRAYHLTDADFAASEMVREVLFLAESNATVSRELQGLSQRLQGARMAAEEEAMTDPLTGLRNRRAVDLVMDRLCAAGAGFGLMHLDLDYFKAVNDTLGHAAGDFVLENVGRILREQLRADDCAARIGGDEFVLIVSARANASVLRAIAERIIARIAEPMVFEGRECRVSASIGIVRVAHSRAADLTDIAAAADRALYAAKHAGRGQVVMQE
jgi:diguanylate cyclase (GGDEF)-like protein